MQRVVGRVQGAHPVNPLLGIGQAVVGDLQVDLRQVVGDVVGGLGQQRLEALAGFVELAALDLGQRQAIAGRIHAGVFVQLGTEALGGQAWGAFIDQGDAGADQLITLAVFGAALGRLLGAVAGIGDTRFGHRVSEEEFRRLGVVAVLAHQALEHARHVARVVAGFFQIEDADAVGFLFVLPGKAPLFLDGCCLGAGDRGDTRVTRTRRGSHDAREQCRHHRQLHALLGFDAPGEVALRQVSQFVGEHRGIFAFGLRIEEQAAIDPDNPARGGEGVEFTAVDKDEFEAAVLQLAGFGQAIDAGLDIILELGVVQLIDIAPQQTEPGAAQLMFLLGGNNRRTGVAE